MLRPPVMGRLLLHTVGLGGVGLLSVASLAPTVSSSQQSLAGLGTDNLLDGGGGGHFIGGKAQPLDPQVVGSDAPKLKKLQPSLGKSGDPKLESGTVIPSTSPTGANPVPSNGAFKDEAAFWLQGGSGPGTLSAKGKGASGGINLPAARSLFQKLYQGPTSLGVVAVGVAEGTYRLMVQNDSLYVQPTRSYYGHIDPGNLSWGARVTNYGPCSDQGRSGGNLLLAAQQCVQRLANRLPTLLEDFSKVSLDPREDVQGFLNAADLYNQASPVHSRRYPKALAIARQRGLGGLEVYAWARTASFYLNDKRELDLENGTNRATGLIGICRREGSASTQWECVYRDQARRVGAIASVYRKFLQVSDPS